MKKNKRWSITTLLKKNNSPDRVLLLAAAINRDRVFVQTHGEYCLSFVETLRWWYYCYYHKRGYSVAAILHHKEFYGLDFFVNKYTLIPRPETELLVESAIEAIKEQAAKNKECILIDVGTGSGCIPIATAHSIRQSGLFEYLSTIVATDISYHALRVAKRNARAHKIPITFLKGNLLEPMLEKEQGTWSKEQLIITANLPYLTQEQFDTEPSIQREPHSALVAANNGVALYEQLLAHVASHVVLDPSSILLLLEIDPSQSKAISELVQKYLPTATLEIKKDLPGNDRMVKIKVSSSITDELT